MKSALVGLLCLLLITPAGAQEKPEKKGKLFDRKLIVAGLTMLAAQIADAETSLAAMRRNRNSREANPIYGQQPGRRRLYAVGGALTGLAFLTAVAAKQHSIRQGNPDSKLWLLPVVVHNTGRGLAAWHNSRIPASRPRVLRVCPAAGAGCR